MKKILTFVLTLTLLLGLFLPSSSLAYFTMYVYTENGKTLNVRTDPWVGDNVIGKIPYGEEVVVNYHLGNGWTALFGAGSWPDTVYVQTRFLVSYKPEKKSTPVPSGNTPSSTTSAVTITDLNKIFKTYTRVNPYTIIVRPTRASGWVNLRWAPSKSAELLGTYGANARLTVIAELKDWYQVEDPATGVVGFMNSAFVTK